MADHIRIRSWAVPGLLALNAALMVLVIVELRGVQRASWAASASVCGRSAGSPCYVVLTDRPAPGGAMLDFWFPDDPADDPAYREAREAMERRAEEARERVEGAGFGRAPD